MSPFLLKQFSRASFHSSRSLGSEWTKASLRRMKKPELIQLAKDHQLNTSGTKNDIIIDLLTYQTTKVVSPTLIKSIEKATPAVDREASPAIEDNVDTDWVNAFDIKVAQRRSGRKPFSPLSESQQSKPHPLNDAFKKKIVLSHAYPAWNNEEEKVEEEKVEEEEAAAAEKVEEEELDGMDPRWVEAFQLKVSSRDKRQKTQDTLSPTTVSDLDPVTIDTPLENSFNDTPSTMDTTEITNTDTIDTETTNAEAMNTETTNTETTNTQTTDTQTTNTQTTDTQTTDTQTMNTPLKDSPKTQSNNEKQGHSWTSAVVGSSMLIWYFGGEEGFSKIWAFFA